MLCVNNIRAFFFRRTGMTEYISGRALKKKNIIVCAAIAAFLTAMPFGGQTQITAYADVSASGSYENIAIARVTDYVNIRSEANTSSQILGKIYNNCAASILDSVDGEGGEWYHIRSGELEGYIKAEYFITGEAAEEIAAQVGTLYGTITGSDLNLRQEPNTQSNVLTRLQTGEVYVILGEQDGFYKVQVDSDLVGYISKDYAETKMVFKEAVSVAQEAEKQREEAELKQNAEAAVNRYKEAVIAANPETDNAASISVDAPEPVTGTDAAGTAPDTGQSTVNINTGAPEPGVTIIGGSQGGPGTVSGNSSPVVKAESAVTTAKREAIVAYAKQFLGNPYVYGGTSLTNGADCSGFVMKIFEYFGIDTGRDSRSQAANCTRLSFDEIKPGDLLFYASGDYINHVAIYIGDGKVIHSSNPDTGIIISDAYYRTPYMAGTFITE